MKTYEVIRYYTVADHYEVEAQSESEAYEKAKRGEYLRHRSYDDPEDQNVEIEELTS